MPVRKGLGHLLHYLWRYAAFGVLYGFSLGYQVITQLRRRGYQKGILRSHVLPCPVISIGNITTGGTGKTPLVILVAQIFQQQGKRVAILSRGYRRHGSPGNASIFLASSTPGETWAIPDVRLVGDEPLLIARKFQRSASPALPEVAVIVGSQRYFSGKLAIQQFHAEVILLDDGFQHLQLQRVCDLVLIDATQPFGGGYLLPAGFLRESVTQLVRAHAFVITRSDEVDELAPICQRLRQINPNAPIFKGRHVYDKLRQAGAEEYLELECLKGKRLLSISGLGNPASFQRLLAQLGVNVVKSLTFPDHHWYTAQDIAAMQQLIATSRITALITTEKDEAKLFQAAAGLNIPIFVMTIKMDVQPAQDFEHFLLQIASSGKDLTGF